VEADIQGPFPVIAFDGTKENVKFIDGKSGYCKMETIPNGEANTVLQVFKRFKARMERRTGKLIKNIRTDDGAEFKKGFLKYVEDQGIVKQKGLPYRHNHPGKAERAHQTIMSLGRAMLIASKLPASFYAEAQLTAAYIFNRFVHGQDTKTPYEYIYGKKPNLSHLGTICYAHIPSERRTKLDQSADRCRLLGYSDDDDTEEFRGYKLLRESDLAIIYAYTSDVTFDESRPIDPLENYSPYDDDIDDIFSDSTYEENSPIAFTLPPSPDPDVLTVLPPTDPDVLTNPFKKGPLHPKRRPATVHFLEGE
jgi:hypothetical protein